MPIWVFSKQNSQILIPTSEMLKFACDPCYYHWLCRIKSTLLGCAPMAQCSWQAIRKSVNWFKSWNGSHTNNKHKHTENVVDLPLKEESGLQSATGTCHFRYFCMFCVNASIMKKCMWLVLWHVLLEKWLVQGEGITFNTTPITESHPYITYPSTDNHTQLVFTKENRRLWHTMHVVHVQCQPYKQFIIMTHRCFM